MATLPTRYEVTLLDAFGNRLAYIPDFFLLSYARKVNDVGNLSISMPFSKYKNLLYDLTGELIPDRRIEVRRSINGALPYLDGETVWFVRYASDVLDDVLTLQAEDTISLINRRIVAYAAGSSQATKTTLTAADDLIKTVIKENMGSSATDASRDLSAYISVQANLSQGQLITKSFAWQQLLSTIQAMAQDSTIRGTFIAFDIVSLGGGTNGFQFRTYSGQRGTDHRFPTSTKPVILDAQLGNLTEIIRTFDLQDEKTYIYVAGQGEGSDRATATASNSTRIGLSPFGRIEGFQDARNTADSNSLTGEANDALRQARAKRLFTAKYTPTDGILYGRDFNGGDQVTCQYKGSRINCFVDTVQITFNPQDRGKEVIDLRLQSVA
jgi:hypothetical protein